MPSIAEIGWSSLWTIFGCFLAGVGGIIETLAKSKSTKIWGIVLSMDGLLLVTLLLLYDFRAISMPPR